MPVFDASRAEVAVFTTKQGLLAAVGHDLELAAGDVALTLESESGGFAVRLAVKAASLRVLHAIASGAPVPLPERDRRSIDAAMRDEVLEARAHPEIRFSGSAVPDGAAWRLEGELDLHGARRPLAATVTRFGDGWSAEATLDQRAFGIRPYSAMFGALRVEPLVRVRVRLRGFTP